MAHPSERPGPDLRPWDQALALRVQPVLSALFHDIMSPLTLLKNRLYLIQRQLRRLAIDPNVPAEVRTQIEGIISLMTGIEESANRIHRGMTVPRDAIWATILEGTSFDPAKIVEEIGHAMRAPEAESPPPRAAGGSPPPVQGAA
jgi:hypothetical protein